MHHAWVRTRSSGATYKQCAAEDVVVGSEPMRKWTGLNSFLNLVDFGEPANGFLRAIGARSDVSPDHVVKVMLD